MISVMPPASAVLLPGTGSDDVFVRAVFTRPLERAGITAAAPPPPPGAAVAEGSLALLDDAADAAGGPILVGGVSFGAHLSLEWAVTNPGRCAGVLAALPAWHGEPADAPASLAARWSARQVREDGLETAVTAAVEGVPAWLADELTRAWRRHGDGLADALDIAAARVAPSLGALGALDVPVGIATCVDDPIHPAKVAYEWAAALPRAAVRETTLTAVGADRACLGETAVSAWRSVA